MLTSNPVACRALVVLFATLALSTPVVAADSSQSFIDAAPERLANYIRVDTTNPPGNETRGAEFFAAIFEAAGVKYEIAEPAPGRGNIWARITAIANRASCYLTT